METKEQKRLRNQKYRRENQQKIKEQRKESRQTKEYKRRVKTYYKNNVPRFLLSLAKCRAKSQDLNFNLELSDIVIPEICPISGIPLTPGKPRSKNTPSVDRIIPSQGYVKGNIQIISFHANRIKADANFEELIKVGEWAARERSKKNSYISKT